MGGGRDTDCPAKSWPKIPAGPPPSTKKRPHKRGCPESEWSQAGLRGRPGSDAGWGEGGLPSHKVLPIEAAGNHGLRPSRLRRAPT